MAEPLVSPAWLASRLGSAGVMVLDLRLAADGGRTGFEAGHIPGAVFSDYAGDGWRVRQGNVPGLLPDESHLAALFGRLGITRDQHVVIAPVGSTANDFAASARAFWTLRIAGHDAVSILDGGTRGWISSGHTVETGPDAPASRAPYPVVLRDGLRADAADVLKGEAALVDGRAASYFNGLEKASEARRAGHIPGAVSVDYALNFDVASGRLRPLEQLEAAFSGLPAGRVVSYCNTGHTAALNWFVLSELMGRDTSLYDGSMTDWIQDDTRPVMTV